MLKPAISEKEIKRLCGGFSGYVAPVEKTVKKKKKKKRSEHNRWKRRELLAIDPRCYYCNTFLTLNDSTLDHCVPKCLGGGDDDYNVVLACFGCNQDKGDKIFIKRTLD